MVNVAVAPCSPFSVSRDLMRESAALARAYGVRLHTHLAENDHDIAYSREKFGCTPAEYAQDLGWLGRDVWHAHCVKLDPAGIALFAQHAHRRRALPVQQHAPRLGHRADPPHAGRRRAGRPRRGRQRQQRRRADGRRGAPGLAAGARRPLAGAVRLRRGPGRDDGARRARARHARRRAGARPRTTSATSRPACAPTWRCSTCGRRRSRAARCTTRWPACCCAPARRRRSRSSTGAWRCGRADWRRRLEPLVERHNGLARVLAERAR